MCNNIEEIKKEYQIWLDYYPENTFNEDRSSNFKNNKKDFIKRMAKKYSKNIFQRYLLYKNLSKTI